MVKRLFKWFLAVFFPWIVILAHDNPGGAVMALIMQASIIGWLPATAWALRLNKEDKQRDAARKAKKKAQKQQEKELSEKEDAS